MDSQFDIQPPLIIDNGTGIMKAGLNTSPDKPELVFQSQVGRPKHLKILPTTTKTAPTYCGKRADDLRGLLKMHWPIERGIIKDFNDIELLWRYCQQELGNASTSDHPVLLTEGPLSPNKNREKTAEIFFARFSAPALQFATQATLSLIATGKEHGVVLDVGEGFTHCVPIYGGQTIPHAITRSDIAGKDVTDRLGLLLRKAGQNMSTSAERDCVRHAKEKLSYACITNKTHEENFYEDKNNLTPYSLPDGQIMKVGSERFQCTEVLFNPEIIESEQLAVHECLLATINGSDIDLRKHLYQEILLAGGTTMTIQFADRLLKELKGEKNTPKEIKIKIHQPQNRHWSCWIGGSILSNLTSFRNSWIKKSQQDEEGIRALSTCDRFI